MLLIRPLSNASDLGVVDLYLVMHLIGTERGGTGAGEKNDKDGCG